MRASPATLSTAWLALVDGLVVGPLLWVVRWLPCRLPRRLSCWLTCRLPFGCLVGRLLPSDSSSDPSSSNSSSDPSSSDPSVSSSSDPSSSDVEERSSSFKVGGTGRKAFEYGERPRDPPSLILAASRSAQDGTPHQPNNIEEGGLGGSRRRGRLGGSGRRVLAKEGRRWPNKKHFKKGDSFHFLKKETKTSGYGTSRDITTNTKEGGPGVGAVKTAAPGRRDHAVRHRNKRARDTSHDDVDGGGDDNRYMQVVRF